MKCFSRLRGEMCLITVFLVNKRKKKVSLFAALMRKFIWKEFIKSIVSQQAKQSSSSSFEQWLLFKNFHARHLDRKCSKNFPLPKIVLVAGCVCCRNEHVLCIRSHLLWLFVPEKNKINSTETWSLSFCLCLYYVYDRRK